MRIRSQASAIVGAAALLLLIGAGCSASIGSGSADLKPPSPGDFVLTKPDDGFSWEEGNIDQINGATYTVKLRSNDEIVARPLTAIALLPTKSADVKVGDKVVAEWVPDLFYSGVVTAVGVSSATVKWDDGSAPSDVSLLRITTTFK